MLIGRYVQTRRVLECPASTDRSSKCVLFLCACCCFVVAVCLQFGEAVVLTSIVVRCAMDELKLVASWRGGVSGAVVSVTVSQLLLQGCRMESGVLAESGPTAPELVRVPDFTLAWIPQDAAEPYKPTEVHHRVNCDVTLLTNRIFVWGCRSYPSPSISRQRVPEWRPTSRSPSVASARSGFCVVQRLCCGMSKCVVCCVCAACCCDEVTSSRG